VPKSRCLSCRKLIDSRLSRCPPCKKAVKDERNRQARQFGSCPQVGTCGYCHGMYGPATRDNPFIWGHYPVRFIDGGTTVIPLHRLCNEKHSRVIK
jgi:hypothetical protein